VKGLGPKRKEIIKKAYPTLESLLNADVYELSQLVGENVAVELLKKLQK
jgi:excinuclease UvrABC nuclease subunit